MNNNVLMKTWSSSYLMQKTDIRQINNILHNLYKLIIQSLIKNNRLIDTFHLPQKVFLINGFYYILYIIYYQQHTIHFIYFQFFWFFFFPVPFIGFCVLFIVFHSCFNLDDFQHLKMLLTIFVGNSLIDILN